MEVVLLDTNIVSELFRRKGEFSLHCAEIVSKYEIASICFLTLAELLVWPKLNQWGPSRFRTLREYLADFPAIYPDDTTCEVYSEVRLISKQLGRPMSDGDSWIAAVALQYKIPLLTRNHRDFNFLDDLELIPIEDPATSG